MPTEIKIDKILRRQGIDKKELHKCWFHFHSLIEDEKMNVYDASLAILKQYPEKIVAVFMFLGFAHVDLITTELLEEKKEGIDVTA